MRSSPSKISFCHWLERAVIGLTLLCNFSACFGRDPCLDETFERARLTREQIYQDFTGAIFRISVTSAGTALATGTGYLIDSETGYTLTARHVLDRYFETSGASIEATSPYLPGKTLHLEVVQSPKSVDLVLLKALETNLTSQITPLDIALHLPPRGSTYYTIGYPKGQTRPHAQEVEILGPYQGPNQSEGLLDAKQNVAEGWSGSPLIGSNGAVLGTCLQDVYRNEAIYQPLVDAQTVLDALPADRRVETLDRELRYKSDIKELINKLQWRRGNPSNVLLYAWATKIATDPAAYNSLQNYFACPLIPAYYDRRLDEKATATFFKSMSLPSQAETFVSIAARAAQQGQTDEAYDLSKNAAQVFAKIPQSNSTTSVATIRPPTFTIRPLVVLMDSHLKGVVYCKDTFEKGGSNSDDIADLLSDLPVAVASIPTNLDWNDYERLIKLNPSLIIIHASAFYKETQELKGNLQLLTFLGQVRKSPARILVYTRGLPEEPSERLNIEWTNLVGQVNLSNKAQLIVMPRGHASCFHDPAVAVPFKKAVMRALGIDS